jgi:hypothetical protein
MRTLLHRRRPVEKTTDLGRAACGVAGHVGSAAMAVRRRRFAVIRLPALRRPATASAAVSALASHEPLVDRLAPIMDADGVRLWQLRVCSKSVSLASPCFTISLSTLYRRRLPHGWQTIVSVGSRTSDRVNASFGIRRTIACRREPSQNTIAPRTGVREATARPCCAVRRAD